VAQPGVDGASDVGVVVVARNLPTVQSGFIKDNAPSRSRGLLGMIPSLKPTYCFFWFF